MRRCVQAFAVLLLIVSVAGIAAGQKKPPKPAQPAAEEKASKPAAAEQAAPKPLLDLTFEVGDGGWTAFGNGAEIRVTHTAAEVKNGKGALALDYEIVPKQIGVAALPNLEGALAKMTSLSFWLKTDWATAVAVLLSENKPGGGDYTAIIWSPKNTWQHIELVPADFALNEGPNDPIDLDGQLDLDQVQNVGILDLAALFAGARDSKVPIVVDQRSGKHTLCIDDFQALAGTPGAAPKAEGVVIDDFHKEFLAWLTPGGVELSLGAADNPLHARALQARYQQTPEGILALVRSVAHLDLRHTGSITIDLASAQPAQLMLSLETKKPGVDKGVRYSTLLQVPGDRQMRHMTISLAELKRDENAPADSPEKPDTAELKTLSLADITGVVNKASQTNTLWIANIKAQ